MPHILPLAATAAAAAAPIATATAATATASTLSATLVSVASQAAVSMAINAAMSVLSPKVGSAGRPVDWTLNPDGPIPFAFGRVGVAGAVVHKRTFGPDKMYYGFVSCVSGAGPIAGFEAFTADDFPVTFNGAGMAVTSEWTGEMWRATRLGTQPDTWLPTPTGLKHNAILPNWTASHRASGKALSMLVMGENSKRTAYPNGEVKPLEIFRGLLCWDPRLDSSYPGGAGSCRLDNPSTWVWSENPIICALRWCLGLWESPTGKGTPFIGQQVGGIGSRLSGIDVPAFVAAANVCDANGWTCAAYPNTDDDKHQVLVSFLQAAGAIYSQRAGKISLIQRAAPRASVATITADDVVGPIEVDTAASRIDRINTIQPTYWSPEHRWQMTALPEVTAQAYRDADGGKRSRGITYPYVSKAKQAAQLAALEIAHSREGMAGQVALKPYLQRIQPGDVFTITEPGFLLDGLKCLCMSTEYDPAEAVVRVTFVSETDAKYPFALGQSTTPPTPPTLVAPDYDVSPPLPGDWVITPRPPAPDGTQIPGFDLEGIVSNDMATAVIVEWGLPPDPEPPIPLPEGKVWADYVNWISAYQGPPTVTNIPIVGVQSGETYFIAVRYQRDSRFSERYVYGPFVAPTLSAGIDQEALDEIRNDFNDLFGPVRDDVAGLVDASMANAAAILKEAQDRAAALLKEAQDRVADILAERTARGEDIAEVVSSIDVVKTDLSAEVATRTSQIAAVEGSVSLVETAARTYADDKIAEATLNFTTTAAFQNALSTTLNSANTYADGVKTYADQTFATVSAMGSGLASTLSSSKTYSDGIKSYADQTFATTAALGDGLAGTLTSSKTYADGIKTYADQTFATTAALGTANAATLSTAKSYADDKVAESSLTYATKSERSSGDASTLASSKSYTDDLRSEATTLFATKSALGTVTADASLALSTAVAADGTAKSLIGLETQVGGLITGIYSGNDGRIGSVRISANHFSVETPGNPGDRIEFTGTNGLKLFKSGTRRIQIGFV